VHGSRKQELKLNYEEKKKMQAKQSSKHMKAVQDPEKMSSTALHSTYK
jgi:hypothetical protein